VKPTFERFSYALRPAKNIERKMLCEAFARLARIAPLPSYRYIGFGALGFHDFVLFHQRLGIEDMTSIECELTSQDRITFNRPYSCIRMKWGLSHDVLPTLQWKNRTILWLDYDSHLNARKLNDIALAATSLKSGSVLVVTLPADPGPVEADADMGEKRLSDLRARVGKDKVPSDIEGGGLAQWGTAKAYRRIVTNEVLGALSARNGALTTSSRTAYRQLFNFHYADGVKMVTVGGLLLNPTDARALTARHFKDLEFIRTDDDPYVIETPLLTRREIHYLDERLPRSAPDVNHPGWIPELERRKYARVYRYFPSFSEVEA
jgi:hypothetical protein